MRFLFLLLFLFTLFQAVSQDWSSLNSKGMQLYREGKYTEAIVTADQALELATHQYGKNTSQYMATLSNKGYAQAGLGDYLQALSNFKQVVNLSFLVYSLPHGSQVESLAELSKTYVGLATYDSAEYYLNWAKFVLVAISKDNRAHYDTAIYALFDAQIAINSLDASIHYSKGQVPQAIQLLELQLTMLKEIYPDNYESWPTYQTTVNNLFTYNNEIYNLDQALQYARMYYRLIQSKLDPLNEINALQNLGSIYSNREQYDSANFYWQEALDRIANSNYKKFLSPHGYSE
ncbi:MAG: tetratricopeptide repeat protein [Cytophagales bacterium]|nr:tetratricopeptide repeat protein [Cytophagales bacterium]